MSREEIRGWQAIDYSFRVYRVGKIGAIMQTG